MGIDPNDYMDRVIDAIESARQDAAAAKIDAAYERWRWEQSHVTDDEACACLKCRRLRDPHAPRFLTDEERADQLWKVRFDTEGFGGKKE